MLHPESMQLTNQCRQACCACSFLTATGHRTTDGNDVEAFDARDAVGGVFLLQPIHLVPVQLCRPPRSQHAGPTESRTADRPACVGRRSARLAS
jgi:hypothetical protein